MLVLDSGGVTALATRTTRAAAIMAALRRGGLWPPSVPAVVLVECLSGRAGPNARVNMLLKLCEIVTEVPETVARRAGTLRTLARRGSAVDALVVASAEPGGTILTSDPVDLSALAQAASDVVIEPV